MLRQQTTRHDGSVFFTYRHPKLFIVREGHGDYPCTSVAHAAEVLEGMLGREVKPGHISRRNPTLGAVLLDGGYQLRWRHGICWPY